MRIKFVIVIYLVSYLFFSACSFLYANPFISSSEKEKKAKTMYCPVVVQKIIAKVAPIQKKLQSKLSTLIKEFKNTGSKITLFFLLFIAFIFGIIHAIGPGHGKTILFTYFLAKRTVFIRGILVSTVVAFLHAISAVLIVSIVALILKKAYLTSFNDMTNSIQLISYTLIICIGVFLLIKASFSFIKTQKNGKIHEHLNENMMSSVPIMLAAGMIPCPGALIILLFSLSFGIIHIGIMMVFMMALGMSITISSASSLGLILHKNISILALQNKIWYKNIYHIIHIMAAIFICLLGTVMLLRII